MKNIGCYCTGICLILFFLSHDDYDVVGLPIKDDGETMTTAEVLTYMVRYGYLEDRQGPQVAPSMATAPPTNLVSTQSSLISSNNNGHPNQVGSGQTIGQKKDANGPVVPEGVRKGAVKTLHFTDREIETALYDFQRFMDLPLSGRLDDTTSASMKKSRCGIKDKLPHLPWTPLRTDQSRRRRYVVQGSKWQSNLLTYTIAKPSTKLTFSQLNATLKMAVQAWSEVIPLMLRWTDDVKSANIVVKFEKGDHGDFQRFDSKGNILAHAFYPSDQTFGGQIHFDDDENWDTGTLKSSDQSKNLFQVALHALGHVLGLQHSSIKTAVMYPLYIPKSLPSDMKLTRAAVLDPDDIAGIQSLYGNCGSQLDSIFSWMGDGKTYAFKGQVFWKMDDVAKETVPGYPKPISSTWKGIPDDIDEAFLWGFNWKTYFFKGKYYYRYHDSLGKVDDDYPKLISEGWPGIPDNIDAAFTWSNHVSYFFKDHLCYRFDNTNNRVYQGYPKNISEVWPGIPDKIDTVFRYYWDGSAYFFSGFEYWKLDDRTAVLKGPLKIANGWKNICPV